MAPPLVQQDDDDVITVTGDDQVAEGAVEDDSVSDVLEPSPRDSHQVPPLTYVDFV